MTTRDTIDAATVTAFRRGDADAFGRISRRYARELHVHCYRMVGSFDDAEDLVQESLMRAWDRREQLQGRAGIRAWLYRIATNACIDAIRARKARVILDNEGEMRPQSRFPWMQPYPDALLDAAVSSELSPDARLVSRDTIELAFLVAIQSLPPKQRAVLLLRDVMGFSASETAEILDDTTPAVNSALQRARSTLQRRRGVTDGATDVTAPSFDEAFFLQAFMDAQDRGDVSAMVELLREDVRMTLFPDAVTWDGREEVAREIRRRRTDFEGEVRSVPIAANRQPALAVYLRPASDVAYRAWAVVVLGVRAGKVREIATFASPELFARFKLPTVLSADGG